MEFLTREAFETAIAAIAAQPGDQFRSQAVIEYFRQHEQRAYVQELSKNLDVRSYPFTETNRQIGRFLHNFPHIELIGGATSDEPTALWRRR